MEDTGLQNLNFATWYKLEKDRTSYFIPVFIDYNISTRIGAMLYDREVVPCKMASELPLQSTNDSQAWFLNLDSENIIAIKAAGITVPENIETVSSLHQLRASFNRKQSSH